jgi:hypothetical protein
METMEVSNEIPNLWPKDAIKPNVVSPLAILRVQATLLQKETAGLLLGDVRVTQGNELTEIGFDVIAPGLNGFRFRLLTVTHAVENVYPATVKPFYYNLNTYNDSSSDEKQQGFKAKTQEDFMVSLKQIFQTTDTLGAIQSLLARINESPAKG